MPVEFTRNDACIDIHEQIVCGSMKLVYSTRASSSTGGVKAAYDYRSFGEQIELTPPSTGRVTENFTGKERDDETQLDYFGARYLDPMLGMWTSVDLARQFASDYALRLYCGPKSIEKTKRPKATSPTR